MRRMLFPSRTFSRSWEHVGCGRDACSSFNTKNHAVDEAFAGKNSVIQHGRDQVRSIQSLLSLVIRLVPKIDRELVIHK